MMHCFTWCAQVIHILYFLCAIKTQSILVMCHGKLKHNVNKTTGAIFYCASHQINFCVVHWVTAVIHFVFLLAIFPDYLERRRSRSGSIFLFSSHK